MKTSKFLVKFISTVSAFALFASVAVADFYPQTSGTVHGDGITAVSHPFGLTYPSFNNYTDISTTGFQDSRRFLLVAKDTYDLDAYSDSVNVDVGDTLYFKNFLHNNGDPDENNTTANDVKIKALDFYENEVGQFVTEPFNTMDVTSEISASNTVPLTIGDTATVNSNSGPVRLRYLGPIVAGWNTWDSFTDASSLFGNGLAFGDRDQIDTGTFRGGATKAIIVYYFAKVERAEADLSITRSASTNRAALGTTITYTLDYYNDGPIEAKDTVIIDDYDQSLVSVDSLPAGCLDDGDKVTCQITEAAKNQAGSVEYTVIADVVGTADASAEISSSIADPDTSNNTNNSGSVEIVEGVAVGSVVFNEIMWMGSSVNDNDEWIELRNTTDQAIDLSGFQITRYSSGNEIVMVNIPNGKTIPAHGYFLVANYSKTSSNSALNVTPDMEAPEVLLANSDLQLKLYDTSSNTLVDIADDASGTPFAGNAVANASMHRKWNPGDGSDPDNWFTSQLSYGLDNGIADLATPGNTSSSSDYAFPETVYSNGSTNSDWIIYDNNPAGATAISVDGVINFTGNIMYNGTRLLQDLDSWENDGQEVLQFDMKTTHGYYIIVKTDTNQGEKTIVYGHQNYDRLDTFPEPNYGHIGLGYFTADGNWRTIVRDLEEDLKYIYGDSIELREVIYFSARSEDIYIDNVKLLRELPEFVYEDGSADAVNRWQTSSEPSVNGVVTAVTVDNISDGDGDYVRLEGNYDPNDGSPDRNPSALAVFKLFANDGNDPWYKNPYNKILSWKWRWRGDPTDLPHNDFRFSALIRVNKGGAQTYRYIVYMPRSTSNASYIQKDKYCYINIGARETAWSLTDFDTITRNLEDDLETCAGLGNVNFGATGDIDYLELIRFQVNGVGDIDDVVLQ